jgi:hypothetical protein
MKHALLLLLVACAKPEPQGIAPPVPTQSIDSGVVPTDVVRTVSFRNPFGDDLHPDNLMLDGDFELTGRSGQTPWTASNGNGGSLAITYETGGHCRSGVRCGYMPAGSILLGYAATPPAGKLYIRVWGKPEAEKCSDLSVVLFDSTTNQNAGTAVAQELVPDANGWCLYEGVLQSLPFHEPILFLRAKDQGVTIDAVLALPTTGPKPLLAGPPLSPADERLYARLSTALRHRGEPMLPPAMDPPQFQQGPM